MSIFQEKRYFRSMLAGAVVLALFVGYFIYSLVVGNDPTIDDILYDPSGAMVPALGPADMPVPTAPPDVDPPTYPPV